MPNTKTYILDTTVLIDDPDLMYKLSGAVVIPLAVIKEIDGLKRSDDEYKAKAARKVARTLDRLGSYGDLREGVKLSTGGILRVYTGYDAVDGLHSEADNRIVGVAMRLQREVGNVTLLTTDGNMRTVARVNGVKGEMIDVDVGASYERKFNIASEVQKLKRKRSNIVVRVLKAFNKAFLPKKVKMFFIFFVIVAITLTELLYAFTPLSLKASMAFVLGFMLLGIFLLSLIQKGIEYDEDYEQIRSAYWLQSGNWGNPFHRK